MKISSWRKGLPVLLPLLIFIGTEVYGLDFGSQHPDEPFLIRETIYTLENNTFLPRLYNYPSVSYWLTLTGLLPSIIFNGEAAALRVQELGMDYYLRVRLVFLLISSLAILWVYLTVYVWRQNWLEALIAASILGFSWEFAYHARWIAPDAILMQFAALTLLFCMLAVLHPQKICYLYFAVIAAGLATGTKYIGGLLILLLLLVGYRTLRDTLYKNYHFILLPTFFTFTYLMTTPGTLLASDEFWKDVRFEVQHYGEIGHNDQTVEPGLDHLSRNLNYLSRVAFSAYTEISIGITVLMLIGIYVVIREKFYTALLIGIFPLTYIAYISMQRVMFVRNLLVIFPFMAIFAARGIGFLAERSQIRALKIGIVAATAIFLSINAHWLYTTAQSIYEREDRDVFAEFMNYAAENPEIQFSVSDQIKGDIDKNGIPLPSNMAVSAWDSKYDYGVFYMWEVRTIVPPNFPDTLSRWFGSHDINLNYYPLWNNHYVIVLTADKVTRYFVPIFKKKNSAE